jgi:hypothetical protein
MLLLRVGRRRTAWESDSVDTIIKTEFTFAGQLELPLSVYRVSPDQVVQAVAEFSATIAKDPRGFDNIDLEGGGEAVATPGETSFEFTRAAHRDLAFVDEAHLREFLRDVVIPEIERRRHRATKVQIKAYVQERLAANDPEWTSLIAARGKWP